MDRLYVCPLCDWSLAEPDPAGYPDTEQGQDNFAADYAYYELEKELHSCVSWVAECLGDLRSGRLPL